MIMPKIVNKEEKRIEILEAAIRLFAKKGVGSTKINEIAELAGIGKGTIYEYFNSKTEIFNATLHLFIEKINNYVITELRNIYDPFEKLHKYLQVWAELLDGEYSEFMDITLDFWAEGIRQKDKKIFSDFKNIYRENLKMIEVILEDCIMRNAISPVNTEIVSSIIIAVLDGLMIQSIYNMNNFNMKKSIELFSEIIMNGLRRQNNERQNS
jgi:TetR/AcrR family fatty acid metabolism transcriptional regulator